MWFDAIDRLPLIDYSREIFSKNEWEEKLKDKKYPFALLVNAAGLTREVVSILREHPLLKVLGIESCFPEPFILEYLKALDTMEEVWLQFARITDEFMLLLNRFSNITRLHLDQTKILDQGMSALRKMPQLEELNLASTRITDNGLFNISSLSNLTSLKLQECSNITDYGLESLTELRNVRKLNLIGLKRITDRTTQQIKHMTKLNDLLLLNCPLLSDKGMEDLSEISSITRLAIGSNKISKHGLDYLAHLTNIAEFDLFSNKLCDEDLLVLSPLKKLHYLGIGSNLLTNVIFRYLGQFPCLRSVWLCSDRITDACLKDLLYCYDIEKIDICSTRTSERVNKILKDRQPGRAWADQHCCEMETGIICTPDTPVATHERKESKDDIIPADGNITMKTLRLQLRDIISSIKDYIGSEEDDEDDDDSNCSLADVESLKNILEEYLRTISGKKGDEKNLYKATRIAVKKINKLDDKTDNELIETEEREELCNFFNNGSAYVGIETEDIADEWREW